jgi:hypothetical protein
MESRGDEAGGLSHALGLDGGTRHWRRHRPNDHDQGQDDGDFQE